MVVLGGGASSQECSKLVQLLRNGTMLGVLTNSWAVPCYLQSILRYELIGCSQQPWEVGIAHLPDEEAFAQKRKMTCLKSVSS